MTPRKGPRKVHCFSALPIMVREKGLRVVTSSCHIRDQNLNVWQIFFLKLKYFNDFKTDTYSAFRLEVAQSAAGPDLAFRAFLHYTYYVLK